MLGRTFFRKDSPTSPAASSSGPGDGTKERPYVIESSDSDEIIELLSDSSEAAAGPSSTEHGDCFS